MNHTFTKSLKAFAAIAILCFGAAFAQGPSNFPPTAVYARAYAAWNLLGQQANTFTFNGNVCTFTAYNNGQSSPFFAFSGLNSSTTVYFPVAITDAVTANSEIVTPTSTSNTSASCGFAGTTAHSHTSFVLSSGTAGLQEAIIYQPQSAPPSTVILDRYWYQLVKGLPGPPTSASIINSVAGNANVQIVDTTTAPYTYYCYNGTNYTACAGNYTVPTLTSLGQGAGGTPASTSIVGTGTTGIIKLTTGGTTPTTSANIFLVTWPAIASGGFQYAPVCTVSSIGTNVAPVGTVSTTAGPPATLSYTSNATTALTNSTAYVFSYVCR